MKHIKRFNEDQNKEDNTKKIFDLLDSAEKSNNEIGFQLVASQDIISNTIDELIGKTFTSVKNDKGEALLFINDEATYSFHHWQDCCEYVYIEDINGDLDDLMNSPIIKAEVIEKNDVNASECGMWTFYKFATIKGYVTVRWYGSSNGYYSVSVSFNKMNKD